MQRYYPEPVVENLIKGVVEQHLDGHKIKPCNIFLDIDDDGLEYYSVGLCYEFSEHPVDPEKSIKMMSAVQNELEKVGDNRMPIIDHYFDDNQKIKGFERAC